MKNKILQELDKIEENAEENNDKQLLGIIESLRDAMNENDRSRMTRKTLRLKNYINENYNDSVGDFI